MEVKNKAGEVQQQGLSALFFSLIVYLTTILSTWWETAKSFKENISNPELWRLFISSIPWRKLKAEPRSYEFRKRKFACDFPAGGPAADGRKSAYFSATEKLEFETEAQFAAASVSSSSVKVIDVGVEADFECVIKTAFIETRKPVVIRGYDIGLCREKWTPEFLISNCPPEKKVKVHKSKERQLDFRRKNFVYDTVSFRHLIWLCSGIRSEEVEKDKYQYFWYLRSIGKDPRGKDVSDISVHFPTLAADLKIPKVFPEASFFSSVFRITSPHLQLWTHYDTCDNILIQIRGRKRIFDIDNPDFSRFPKFKGVEHFDVILEEGDIVFIPALWFHNVTALDYSISVNVFWKNLGEELYDKKDPYGNKDLIPAQLGYRTLEKIIGQLHTLSPQYQDFYLRRMIVRLEKRIDELSVTGNEDTLKEDDPEA
ncbi:tRNA wybutosine-synthesizing protein 5 [Orchesella cincta]|uniref:tRNA wybutosine-synthesizing protein 5 n=1 Tax=Orchesella cincta TaxID=48709 RepID=A0A1D2MUY2_ORCCI|nr:tRNA wybutosine-synthesizing protein 5 [Orchesella cincta]